MAASPSLLESAQLEYSAHLKQRARNALATYSQYLMNTDPADELYDSKINAARQMGAQPDQTVNALLFWLSGDAEVKAAGADITYTTLQSVVEKTLSKLFPIEPSTPPAARRR